MTGTVTKAAARRLRSKTATHYTAENAPTITVVHRSPSGGTLSTTGRLIAETQRELALIVHGSPVVIPTAKISRRTPHAPRENPNDALPLFSALMRDVLE